MKYICQYCGKEFESTIGKTVHENSCKLNINAQNHNCQYCKKIYKNITLLNNHEYFCKKNIDKKTRFIEDANKYWDSYKRYLYDVHQYSYEKTNIKDIKKTIIVTCKLHGDFYTKINYFLDGHGCKECSRLNRNASHTKTLNDWISIFKTTHNDIYDYSKVSLDDIKNKGKCTIICNKHNYEFASNPVKFGHGQTGCKYCQKEKMSSSLSRSNTNKIIELLKKKHGIDNFDYSLVNCNNQHDNITIICKIHGPFQKTVGQALSSKYLCPDCGKRNFILKNDFLNKCKEIWGNTYDYSFIKYRIFNYSKLEYLYKNDIIDIKCNKHGLFKINVYSHLDNANTHQHKGCPKCKRTYCPSELEFINMCKEKWNNKYDYSKTHFINKYSKITIICPIHGEFQMNPFTHLNGKTGCPVCSGHTLESGKYNKLNKLNLLSKYDLLSMSWSVIIDLIGVNKLPKEFQVLTKYGENTPKRKKMIQDLIDSYNIEVPENDIDETNNGSNNDEIIETEVNNIIDEDTNIYDNENEELNPFKETKTIGEILGEDFDETLFSTGDKWLHIMSKEIGKLWNKVLRDNENHNENTINEIHQKLINNSLTKFEKYIYEEFMKEYDEVINLEVH